LQHGFKIRVLLVGLAPGAAGPGSEVFKDEVDIAVEAVGRDDRR
jgi:hypothetical protein